MKAYLYSVKTGVYEGETFEEAAMLQYEDGLTTTPPPDYDHGQVAVFDRQKSSWTVIPVSIASQLLNGSSLCSKEHPA